MSDQRHTVQIAVPEGKIIISGGNLPRVDVESDDKNIWRRVAIIPWAKCSDSGDGRA